MASKQEMAGIDNPSAPPLYSQPDYQQQPNGYAPQQIQYANQTQSTNVPSQVVIVRQTQLGVPPKDYMAMAIIVTFCCCLPFGIVGIIKASEAKNLYITGNYPQAEAASRSAGSWTKAGLIFGIVIYIFVVAFTVIWIAVVASIGYDY